MMVSSHVCEVTVYIHRDSTHIVVQKTNFENMLCVREAVSHLGISLGISCQDYITPSLC